MSRAYRNLLKIRPQLARGIEWSFWDLSDQVCTCLFKNNMVNSKMGYCELWTNLNEQVLSRRMG